VWLLSQRGLKTFSSSGFLGRGRLVARLWWKEGLKPGVNFGGKEEGAPLRGGVEKAGSRPSS